jgi:hypothetical protein
MVIFGKTIEELQSNLNNLKLYCDKLGKKVNTDKTKTTVFRKRKKIRENEKNGHTIYFIRDC